MLKVCTFWKHGTLQESSSAGRVNIHYSLQWWTIDVKKDVYKNMLVDVKLMTHNKCGDDNANLKGAKENTKEGSRDEC